jgi:hypothetical protein
MSAAPKERREAGVAARLQAADAQAYRQVKIGPMKPQMIRA